jgi:hypothetical protein
LQPQFNFSSASHSLLSVFRALSGTHGQAIAARSKDAVAQQVAILLPMAQAVGPVCVATMPAEQRDKYIKQVLVVQGLVALTSAVARNVTAMLPQVRSHAFTGVDLPVQHFNSNATQSAASPGSGVHDMQSICAKQLGRGVAVLCESSWVESCGSVD